jgi:DNA-binding Lrp family transcriptional regulator
MNLSKRDLKLLFELDSNYRQPYSRIGRGVRMSQQLVSYKVKSLTSGGILLGNFPLIDYSRFGYLGFRVFFKVNYADRQKFSEMVEKMKKHPSITMVMDCEGRYDLMLVFAARNPSSFNKMLRDIISDNPEQLKNCMILTTVVEHHFLKKYLTTRKVEGDTVIGGDRETVGVDETDRKILRALTEGRKSIVEIAGFSRSNPKTVMSRLRKLERGVINGYRMMINNEAIGISTNKILIKYHNISVEREDELRRFCRRDPNITEFIKTFGEWDLELTVETRTKKEFRNLYLTLREGFEDIIQDFDNFSVFRVHKRQTLPEEFFET